MSQYLIPILQTQIEFCVGSPEGYFKRHCGWLITDGINGSLYQKKTDIDLDTGWEEVHGSGVVAIDVDTGVADPNGSKVGNKGDIFTEVVGPGEAYIWIKTTDGGNTGWI